MNGCGQHSRFYAHFRRKNAHIVHQTSELAWIAPDLRKSGLLAAQDRNSGDDDHEDEDDDDDADSYEYTLADACCCLRCLR